MTPYEKDSHYQDLVKLANRQEETIRGLQEEVADLKADKDTLYTMMLKYMRQASEKK